MSSVSPIATQITPSGTDLVSALALDAQIALIVNKINELIVAMGTMREATDSLADGVVVWRMFSARAKQVLSDLVTNLGLIYQRSTATRWTTLPVTDGVDYVAEGDDFFSGVTPAPSTQTWSIEMPGDTQVPFRARMLIRHFAAPSPSATVQVTQSGSVSQVWDLNPAPMEVALSRVLEFTAYGGDIITVTFVPGDQFTGRVAFPQNREARFPYRPRYRAVGALQFDWMAFDQRSVGSGNDSFFRLLEDDSYRLLEDGSFRLLESAP